MNREQKEKKYDRGEAPRKKKKNAWRFLHDAFILNASERRQGFATTQTEVGAKVENIEEE
jgi:hypothetical protein